MHGLFRVRGFTQVRLLSTLIGCYSIMHGRTLTMCFPGLVQDDGHIFCLPTQIETEIIGVLDLTETLLSQFGFQDFEVRGGCCCRSGWFVVGAFRPMHL